MAQLFTKRKRYSGSIAEHALPIVFFILLLAGLLSGTNGVFHSVKTEQLKSAEQAVRRATVQCYALEGSYPSSVDYLVQNYGLAIDPSRYIIHYRHLGSNLMPQISVFAVEADTAGGVVPSP